MYIEHTEISSPKNLATTVSKRKSHFIFKKKLTPTSNTSSHWNYVDVVMPNGASTLPQQLSRFTFCVSSIESERRFSKYEWCCVQKTSVGTNFELFLKIYFYIGDRRLSIWLLRFWFSFFVRRRTYSLIQWGGM